MNGGHALGHVIGKAAYASHDKIMSIEDLSACLICIMCLWNFHND